MPYSAYQIRQRLELAWKMARDMSKASQNDGKERRDVSRRSPTYTVGQRVLLRKDLDERTGHPKGGTKLTRLYDGPYRIEAILDHDNVKLRDVPSTWTHSEYHVSRLRPYEVYVDQEELADDEFIVEALLDRRGKGAACEYKTKWKGYARRHATWVPRSDLLRRCAEEVAEFDARFQSPPQAGPAPEPADPGPCGGAGQEVGSSAPKEDSKRSRDERAAARGLRLFNDRSQRLGVNAVVSTVTTGPTEKAHWLGIVTTPSRPIAAAVITGVWHYLTRSGPIGVSSEYRWLNETRFSPAQRARAAVLRALPRGRVPSRQGQETIASAAAPTGGKGYQEAAVADIWRPPSRRAESDKSLLKWGRAGLSQCGPSPGGLGDTDPAAERMRNSYREGSLEKLKARLTLPEAQWEHLYKWVAALARNGGEPVGRLQSRLNVRAGKKGSLPPPQCHAIPLLVSIPQERESSREQTRRDRRGKERTREPQQSSVETQSEWEERMISEAMVELGSRESPRRGEPHLFLGMVARPTRRGQTVGAYSPLEEVIRYMSGVQKPYRPLASTGTDQFEALGLLDQGSLNRLGLLGLSEYVAARLLLSLRREAPSPHITVLRSSAVRTRLKTGGAGTAHPTVFRGLAVRTRTKIAVRTDDEVKVRAVRERLTLTTPRVTKWTSSPVEATTGVDCCNSAG